MSRRRAARISAMSTALVWSVPAAADPPRPAPAYEEPMYGVGSVGLLYSYVAGSQGGSAVGGEASYTYFPERGPPPVGFGAFVQVQAYPSDTVRTAAGGQLVYSIFGAELGWAYRSSDGVHAGMHGIHVAPFISLGVLHIATRGTLALSGGDPHWASEFAFTIGLKAPFPAPRFPEYINMNMPSGRPLREKPFGRPILAKVSARSTGTRARTPSRARDLRRWVRVAREEHASVVTFARLTEELAAHGAPAELVARSLAAALEERGHAADALAIASAIAGRRLSLERLPVSPPRSQSLCDLVVESYVDGCLGEGLAAEVARRARGRRAPQAVRRFHATVAREERSHAELAWSILKWALAEGGDPVHRVLAHALSARYAIGVRRADRDAAERVRSRARQRLRCWLSAAASH
jgi:hypothetical protein